jgi:hypothetical protein
MMELKQIVQNFKNEHIKADEDFPFSLLPLLMDHLVKNGLNISHLNGQFYQDLAGEIFSKDDLELKSYGVDALFVAAQNVPHPKVTTVEKVVVKPKVEAIVVDDIIRTDHLVDNIPNEEDEGDPFYTPPEERLDLRPEDCAPMHYDEEFCASIGVDPARYKNGR